MNERHNKLINNAAKFSVKSLHDINIENGQKTKDKLEINATLLFFEICNDKKYIVTHVIQDKKIIKNFIKINSKFSGNNLIMGMIMKDNNGGLA